jgi:hypothetical protein
LFGCCETRDLLLKWQNNLNFGTERVYATSVPIFSILTNGKC